MVTGEGGETRWLLWAGVNYDYLNKPPVLLVADQQAKRVVGRDASMQSDSRTQTKDALCSTPTYVVP